jgi:hypothetical protein
MSTVHPVSNPEDHAIAIRPPGFWSSLPYFPIWFGHFAVKHFAVGPRLFLSCVSVVQSVGPHNIDDIRAVNLSFKFEIIPAPEHTVWNYWAAH